MKYFKPLIVLLFGFLAAGCTHQIQSEATTEMREPSQQAAAHDTALSAEAEAPKPYAMPRTHLVPIQDTNTDRQYEIYVKLPEDYDKNAEQKYPVIYTTDGPIHMDILSGATEFIMPEVILVGISYQTDLNHERRVAASRARDFTFIEYEEVPVPTGEADNHLTFIRDDVIQYVESNYRVDPDDRTYFGYSAGGSFGAYILFAQTDSFHNYILGSPALDLEELDFLGALRVNKAASVQDMSANVFVSIGELETSKMEITENFMALLERSSPSGLTITGLEIIENSNHSTGFPETVIRGVKWLSEMEQE